MLVVHLPFQPIFLLGVALKRYNGAAEIECMAVFVEHHLGRIGILQRFKAVGFGKRFHQSGYLRGGIVEAFFDGFQLRRLNKRFVTLNISYNFV